MHHICPILFSVLPALKTEAKINFFLILIVINWIFYRTTYRKEIP